MIRRQLPAFSPVSAPKLFAALWDSVTWGGAPEVGLAALLGDRLDGDEVVLTGSGTEALQLALVAVREHAGRDPLVALPAYSCYDLVTAAVGAGVRAVFYDVDPVTLSIVPESLQSAMRSGASAAVVGNLFGFPVDWDRVEGICRDAGALMIEDAAQGLGSGWAGSAAGALGDLSVLSFGRGKGWSGGGGGALLSRGPVARGLNLEGARTRLPARSGARSWLISLAVWALGRPTLYRLPTMISPLGLGETHYRSPGPLRGMSSLAAATALRHAAAAQDATRARRAWAGRWDAIVERLGPWQRCEPLRSDMCGYLRYPLLVGSAAERRTVVGRLRDAGVAAGYPLALPDLPAAADLRPVFPDEGISGAHRLAETLMTLPTHPRMSERDVALVSGQIGHAPGRKGGGPA